jgi:acetoin utilization deacetylase AcuC-like enzyme
MKPHISLFLPAAAAAFLPLSPKQTVALYTSDVCVGHDPGRGHPEAPARLRGLLSALRNEWVPEFGQHLRVFDEREADVTDEQLLRVHTVDHVAKVSAAFDRAKRGLNPVIGMRVNIDADTIVSPGTQAAARRGAGLVVAAVDDLLSRRGWVGGPFTGTNKRPRRAFVMVRPPGHHAEADGPQGFCFFNNVMVGVAHAQAVHGVRRVAILDFDVHHGNGDADIAWAQQNRLYASTHEVPLYPGTGETAGRDRNVLSVPLSANAGSAEFRRAWRSRLLPAVRMFNPEVVFLSSGFDAHKDDPLSSVTLTDDDFAWITAEVASLGFGRIPIISVLEGGYNVKQLEQSVRTHVLALINS